MKAWICLGLLAALVLSLLPGSGVPAADAQGTRLVLAFYYGWYNGGTWADGRLIDRPAEPYDSGDRGAMARQIGQAQSAGIDAFVMSWYGPDNAINTAIFESLLDQAASQGFFIAADVDLGSAEFNATPEATLNTLRYLIANLIHRPAYLRYEGKPVIFFWNQGRFTAQQWTDIRAQVDPNHDTIWIAEGDALQYLGVFDGLCLYNIAWSRNPTATAANWAQNVARRNAYWVATAMPGWDDSRMGRGDAAFITARQDGAFFRNTFNAAAASNPHMLIITSWNEYFENSYIEPSQVYGTFYLDLARELIAAYKAGGAPPTAPAGGAVPGPQTSAGLVAIPITSTLNVRQAPSPDAARVAQVTLNNRYPLLARNADGSWWLIDYGGGQGWIAAQYARYEGGDINALPVQ
jgi:hypothetical protein